jgi:hypothetical protein
LKNHSARGNQGAAHRPELRKLVAAKLKQKDK